MLTHWVASPRETAARCIKRAGIRQAIGEMRLIAAESMRALHRAPLAPAVADDDDQRRRFGPTRAAPFAAPRPCPRSFDRPDGELEDTLLLHPVDEIGIVLRVATKQIFLHLGILDHDIFPGL